MCFISILNKMCSIAYINIHGFILISYCLRKLLGSSKILSWILIRCLLVTKIIMVKITIIDAFIDFM